MLVTVFSWWINQHAKKIKITNEYKFHNNLLFLITCECESQNPPEVLT